MLFKITGYKNNFVKLLHNFKALNLHLSIIILHTFNTEFLQHIFMCLLHTCICINEAYMATQTNFKFYILYYYNLKKKKYLSLIF